MGAEQSQKPSQDLYESLGDVELNNEFGSINYLDKKNNSLDTEFANYTNFYYIWSIMYPEGLNPIQRESHFSVYHSKTHRLIIGYGIDRRGVSLNDVWILYTDSLQWKQINLCGDYVSPRYGANAALNESNFLYVFGGYCPNDRKYISDFHRINIETGDVKYMKSLEYSSQNNEENHEPSPRISPFVGVHRDKLCVWGGFNVTAKNQPSEINIYDLKTKKWHNVPSSYTVNCRASYAMHHQYMIVYGAMDEKGFVFIDIDKECTYYLSCANAPNAPPFDLFKPGLIVVHNFIYLIGGRGTSKYSPVYKYKMKTNTWEKLSVGPDNLTVSQNNDCWVDDGCFLLPSADGFSICYDKSRKQFLAVLGNTGKDSTRIFGIKKTEKEK